ncbi:MAG: hypothetical protein WCY21_01225 [Candidatus Cloacimonadaceae bacterium]|jgi:hypothetical protein|nr:hypothetical protein [Candidatus Cloacimonadota bacterium]MDX9949946.1 hypothetical protein [Candidatus Syntrophosphaera sp.]
MKKLLSLVLLLNLAVFAMAYTARNIMIELQLNQLDIMDYVSAPQNTHDADWRITVTDGIDIISTDTNPANHVRLNLQGGPEGITPFLVFGCGPFSTPGYSYGVTFDITLEYLLNDDPATNKATRSVTMPATGNAAQWYYGENAWVLPFDTIPPTYTLRIYSYGWHEPGILLKDGEVIGPTPYIEEKYNPEDLYGVYSMQEVEYTYWTPGELVIDEYTYWSEDFDGNYYLLFTFYIPTPPPACTFTLNLTTDPEGYIISPDPVEVSILDVPIDLWGTYAPYDNPPGDGYWEPAQHVIDANTEWLEDDDGNYYFNFEFVWVETSTYTLSIFPPLKAS